jgi:4-amino-4-deoxy-L-arabinose transferase-like glycosyltransferase
MANAQGDHRRAILKLYFSVGLVAAFICAAFAAAASGVVAVLHFSGSFAEGPGFGLRIVSKSLLFIALSGILLGCVHRYARVRLMEQEHAPAAAASRWGFLPAMLVAALLFFPNLSRHPWPAPDELHHLIVARNLAEHGAYASGMPPNLVYFDSYDSVGAPVIAPVAAAFKAFNVGIVPGRLVLAAYGVALTPLVYFLFLPIFGARASGMAAALPLASFGTIYLSRSLYGEVPALVFVLGGLLLWRRGLRAPRGGAVLALAGAFFGLAVLTKAFMAAAALAVVGAYVFDRATHRRISPRGILVPAAGALTMLALWQAVEFSQRHLQTAKPSLLLYYRHSLSFGVESLWDNLPILATVLPVVLLGIVAIGAAVPRVFRDHYDPALVVVVMLVPLFAFWYAFFTPMHIPRYLWYPAAVAAMFCGPLVARAFSAGILLPVRPRRLMLARGTLAVLMAWVYAFPLADSAYKVFASDQAGPDQAVARYIAGLPADTKVATTYWPAERLLNFLLERPVTVLDPGDAQVPDYDVLIESDRVRWSAPADERAGQRFGHYVVYRRDPAEIDRVARLGEGR